MRNRITIWRLPSAWGFVVTLATFLFVFVWPGLRACMCHTQPRPVGSMSLSERVRFAHLERLDHASPAPR